MPLRKLSVFVAVLTTLALLAAACGDDNGNGDTTESDTTTTAVTTTAAPPDDPEPEPAPDPDPVPAPAPIGDPIPTPNPEVSLPPDVGSTFYQGVGFDLGLVGYEQSEFFLSGTARSFTSETELTSDGRWAAVPADEADYTTRMLVIKPSDAAAFNGTVVVEWFNVTGGLDAAPNFTMSHVEQMREGYAYVGVSAQFRGIELSPGTIDIGFPIFLKGIQPVRYESLNHPGDSFSYDIFNQAAQALRSPVGINPLEGYDITQMLATGESQSASRLTTYVNAIDPVAQLFDGFMIHSRGRGSSTLSQEPQETVAMPEVVFVRDDARVPVMAFQSDFDVLFGGALARQDDSDNYALWEVAGTAHGDLYSVALDVGPQDVGDNPAIAEVREVASPIPGIMDCGTPINSGPQHYVLNAALHALNTWVATGESPPPAPRMDTVENEIDPNLEGRQASHLAVTDEFGNILGGIRSAWVDVPVAQLTGNPVEGSRFCGLFGSTTLFDDDTIAELYPDKATYLDAMTTSIEQSVTDGFIRPADAALILENAASDRIGN